MTDLLRVGANSLLNVQQALNTTGHNISNVNTEGYSRQSVSFAAREAANYGFGFVGMGSYVSDISRSSNDFLTSQVQQFTASESRYSHTVNLTSRLDDVMADANNSLNSSMQDFFNAVQEVASNPGSLPERQVLLSNAQNMITRFEGLNGRFNLLNTEVNNQVVGVVRDINTLVKSISVVNAQVVSATSANNGNPPNDLLDYREKLIGQLSEKVAVTIVRQQDGSVNVFAGQGQALVVGEQTNLLATKQNNFDGSKLDIINKSSPNSTPINRFLTGGEMQALLEFRDQTLVHAQTQLGLLAINLSENVNAVHAKGMDLSGNMGGNFFTTAAPYITAGTSNSGSAVPALTLTDVGDLRASEYRLDYDGTNWQFTRMSDGASVSGTGTLSLDGMDVDLSAGTPTAGDSFVLNPARQAVATLNVALRDPRKIAVASAVVVKVPAANTGTATLSTLAVSDPSKLPLSSTLTLTFDPDASGPGVPGYQINGGVDGVLAYDPATESTGKDFTLAAFGVSVRLGGVPVNGDSIEIGDNKGATGDNRNALAMADLQHQAIINGKQDTLQQYYGTLVAEVGITSREANSHLTLESSLLEQARLYRDSISGVNLDEEAANMLRFQQAYQASAQIIKVADEIFQTLLNSIR